MSKTKKNVFNIVILSILTLFIVVGSVFAFSKIGKNNTSMILHADSTTTNFNGSSVYAPLTPSYYGGSSSWNVSIFSNSIYSGNIWTDNINYYYSSSSTHYVINFSDFTTQTKTWYGLTSFSGQNVWTDNTDIYYSSGGSNYVLDTSTSTWSAVTINGVSSFSGQNVYYFGNNVYLSGGQSGTNAGKQYLFNSSTMTWTEFSTSKYFSGSVVCQIDNFLFARGTTTSGGSTYTTYRFNGSSWSNSSSYISGITSSNFLTNYVWSFSGSTYFSNGSTQKILTETSTGNYSVSDYVWSGISNLTNFTGANIFITSENAYLLYGVDYQYYLDNPNVAFRDSANIFDSVKFTFVDNTNSFNVYQNSMFYIPYNNGILYSLSDKVISSYSSTTIESDFVNYLTFNFNTAINSTFYIPYVFNANIYYAQVNVNSTNGISSLSFVKIVFSGSTSLNGSTYLINNTISYYDINNNSIDFSFVYYSDSDFTLYDFLTESETQTPNDFSFVFSTRTYYLNTDFISTDNYINGRADGYNVGYNDGFNDGQHDGSNTAYQNGYEAGKNYGYAHANEYTFLGLIGAIVDAPIQAFLGLFNFTILGTNIANFITALFTLAVIIVILKKVI